VLFNRGHGERTIGSVYAANTVGAIVGIVAAVHLLMPSVGVKSVVTIGAVLDLALGVWLLALAGPTLRRFELAMSAAAACAAAVFVTLTVELDPWRLLSAVYRTGKVRTPDGSEVLFRRDGKTASIGLIGTPKGARVISTNGKPDAMLTAPDAEPGPDEATMVLAGTFALAHHPGAKTAANIGFGSGLTTHTLLATPQLERVDTVEIERFMVEAARGFGDRVRNAYEDPRSHIYFEDAKAFFATRNARYDLIISEPSNPWVSGVASLFSAEFYARIRNHLNPDGLFIQWVQAYEIDMPLIASILKALDPHFSDYVVYGTNEVDLLIVARRDGALPPLDERVLAHPGLAKEIRRVQVEGVQDLAVRRLAGKRVIQALLASYPVPQNSDYFPFLDQNAARALFADKNALGDLNRVRRGDLPLIEMLEGRQAASVETRVTPTPHFVRATAAREATLVRDAILGRGDWDLVPRTTQRDWILVTLMLDRCDPKADWSQWLDAARRVMIGAIPLLSPAENAAVMAKLRGHRCVARLPAADVQWLDLFDAIGARDANRMQGLASAMLDAGAGDPNLPIRAFLVHAGMLGALAQGRTQEAESIWEKHGKPLVERHPMGFDTRVLLSLSQPELSRQARLDASRGAGGSPGTP
jgi:spermidine synthase